MATVVRVSSKETLNNTGAVSPKTTDAVFPFQLDFQQLADGCVLTPDLCVYMLLYAEYISHMA